MTSDSSQPATPITGKRHGVPLGPVPVFNCIVNLIPAEQGGVNAVVANLPELAIVAPSEREALQRIVAEFKRIVGQRHAAGEAIGWHDPPQPPPPGGQQRLIAVHL